MSLEPVPVRISGRHFDTPLFTKIRWWHTFSRPICFFTNCIGLTSYPIENWSPLANISCAQLCRLHPITCVTSFLLCGAFSSTLHAGPCIPRMPCIHNRCEDMCSRDFLHNMLGLLPFQFCRIIPRGILALSVHLPGSLRFCCYSH